MKSLKILQRINRVIITMKIYINDDNNLVIITSPKTICVNLAIKVNESIKQDLKFIVS